MIRIEHDEVTPTQICTYLSGSSEAPFDLNGGDIASTWSMVRKASKELAKRVKKLSWYWCESSKELQLLVPKEGIVDMHDIARIPPAARQHACRLLREGVWPSCLKSLMAKLDQGKVYEVTSKWSVSKATGGLSLRHG